jgi:hypothetical protein
MNCFTRWLEHFTRPLTFFILAFAFSCNSAFSQSFKDLPGVHTIDSCLIIAKANPGWQIADTAQIRALAPMLKGFAYLTRTKYEGNFIQVSLYNPLKKFIAADMNINEPARYSLVLVR